MISKETFCMALRMIKEQEETDQKFSNALNLVGNGYFVFGTDNQYRKALLMVLKEAVSDEFDNIDWWLYEGAPDYQVWTGDEKKEWCLKEPEALYDFIRNECQ